MREFFMTFALSLISVTCDVKNMRLVVRTADSKGYV